MTQKANPHHSVRQLHALWQLNHHGSILVILRLAIQVGHDLQCTKLGWVSLVCCSSCVPHQSRSSGHGHEKAPPNGWAELEVSRQHSRQVSGKQPSAATHTTHASCSHLHAPAQRALQDAADGCSLQWALSRVQQQ